MKKNKPAQKPKMVDAVWYTLIVRIAVPSHIDPRTLARTHLHNHTAVRGVAVFDLDPEQETHLMPVGTVMRIEEKFPSRQSLVAASERRAEVMRARTQRVIVHVREHLRRALDRL
jgi:hypothetical protein